MERSQIRRILLKEGIRWREPLYSMLTMLLAVLVFAYMWQIPDEEVEREPVGVTLASEPCGGASQRSTLVPTQNQAVRSGHVDMP